LAKETFFHFKSFKIKQPEKGLKVTTEACLLGALANHPFPLNLLDIGCGSGLLSLMVAQRYPNIDLCGIDINDAVVDNAYFNLSSAPFGNPFQIIKGDFINTAFERTFDIIICNPPFFDKHLKSPHDYKNTYLHNDTLPFEQLISKTSTLMNTSSLFWVLLPPYQMSVFIALCQKNNLNVLKKIEIYSQVDKLFRLICCFTKDTTSDIKNEALILFDSNKNMTEDFSTLMADYYLNS
jgi:tRNA1Val (adenine37-N6)-methyltransferase